MKNASSLYARIAMSKKACDKWLASPIRFVSDYTDWPSMNPIMASNYHDWAETFPRPDFMSVREYLDSIADTSRDYCYEYDDDLGAFFIADGRHYTAMLQITTCIAALRSAENFKDNDAPSYIFAFPAISGGDPDALLEIGQGFSRFLNANTDAPDVLYFINEAEEFIEALLDDDD
ncbi:hypothetical protein LJC31_01695 [Synergistaceae bacterium OttesenSCG-928-I11]|nr:hypothetical protein [Synergistaceae bacterium OttesenSCG-928-I11]